MKKRFFHSHPIIAGLIGQVLAFMACTVIATIVIVGLAAGEIISEDMPDQMEMAFNISVTVIAVGCMLVFWWLNRKNGYRGFLKVQGKGLTDVWLCTGIFLALDVAAVVSGLLTMPGGFPNLSAVPFAGAAVMALYSGLNEEVTDRCIPVALMMRNKPTSRRILLIVAVTSVVFAVTHIVNVGDEQSLQDTLIQILLTLGSGLFLAAIYLRTGSIVLPIIIHFVHNLMGFSFGDLIPEDMNNPVFTALSLISKLLPFVLAVLLLLPKHHPAIIDAWTRIWPEKNAPVQESEPVTE